jgi:hypothetical protein
VSVLTDVQLVRYKTTLSTSLITDATINDLIEANTDAQGLWAFENTVADVFDYLAARTGDSVDIKRMQRGPFMVELTTSYSQRAEQWRAKADLTAGIRTAPLVRDDWTPVEGVEYATDDVRLGP